MSRLAACFATATLALISLRVPAQEPVQPPADAPLPDLKTLLLAVEQNQRRFEAAQNDYTYHIHVVDRRLNKDGQPKQTESSDYESLSIDGVRIQRLVAKNEQPLSDKEKQKEEARLDKVVAKAKEERTKRSAKGEQTDGNGASILPVSRILELGSFSNARRVTLAGRPAIAADYTGNPAAKTRNEGEKIIRVLTGTVWIDEQDHALVRGEGQFKDDFKIAGGLVLSVHKGLTFDFQSTLVNNEVWLPSSIDGRGTFRALLFMGVDGETHWRASDYRKFRTSTTLHAPEDPPPTSP